MMQALAKYFGFFVHSRAQQTMLLVMDLPVIGHEGYIHCTGYVICGVGDLKSMLTTQEMLATSYLRHENHHPCHIDVSISKRLL